MSPAASPPTATAPGTKDERGYQAWAGIHGLPRLDLNYDRMLEQMAAAWAEGGGK